MEGYNKAVCNGYRLVKREDIIKPQTTKFKNFDEVMRLRRCQTDSQHQLKPPVLKTSNIPQPEPTESKADNHHKPEPSEPKFDSHRKAKPPVSMMNNHRQPISPVSRTDNTHQPKSIVLKTSTAPASKPLPGGRFDRVPSASRWLKEVATTGHNLQKTCNNTIMHGTFSVKQKRQSEKSETVLSSNDSMKDIHSPNNIPILMENCEPPFIDQKAMKSIESQRKPPIEPRSTNANISSTRFLDNKDLQAKSVAEPRSTSASISSKRLLDINDLQAKSVAEPRSTNSNINRAKRFGGRPLLTGEGKTNPGACVGGGGSKKKRPSSVRLSFEEIMRQRRQHTDKTTSVESPSRKVTFHQNAKLYSGSVSVTDQDEVAGKLTTTALPVVEKNSKVSSHNNKYENKQKSNLADQETIPQKFSSERTEARVGDEKDITFHNSSDGAAVDEPHNPSSKGASIVQRGCKLISDFEKLMKRRRQLTDSNTENIYRNLDENKSEMIYHYDTVPTNISHHLLETVHKGNETVDQRKERHLDSKSDDLDVSKQISNDLSAYDVPKLCRQALHHDSLTSVDASSMKNGMFEVECGNDHRFNDRHRASKTLSYQEVVLHSEEKEKNPSSKIIKCSQPGNLNVFKELPDQESMVLTLLQHETVHEENTINGQGYKKAHISKQLGRKVCDQYSNLENIHLGIHYSAHQEGAAVHQGKTIAQISKPSNREACSRYSNDENILTWNNKTKHKEERSMNQGKEKADLLKRPIRKLSSRYLKDENNASLIHATAQEDKDEDDNQHRKITDDTSQRYSGPTPQHSTTNESEHHRRSQTFKRSIRGKLRNFEDIMRERRHHTDEAIMYTQDLKTDTNDKDISNSLIWTVEEKDHRKVEQEVNDGCFNNEDTKPLVGSLTFRASCRNVPSG